jgi:hypothetical protein
MHVTTMLRILLETTIKAEFFEHPNPMQDYIRRYRNLVYLESLFA